MTSAFITGPNAHYFFQVIVMLGVLLLIVVAELTAGDTNFLTGANDVLAVEASDGRLRATPFRVQFGKTAIWLPRAGHVVQIRVNDRDTGLEMVLDGDGRGYFHVGPGDKRKPRWGACVASSIFFNA